MKRNPTPVPTAPDTTFITLEYDKLKAEQIDRIGRRDNLLYGNLTATAAAVFGAMQAGRTLLLAVPVVGIVLGWNYVTNDRIITDIARYLRTVLAAAAAAAADQAAPLAWESYRHGLNGIATRKKIQLAVDIGAFTIPGYVTIMVAEVGGPWWVIPIGIAETFCLLLLTIQFLVTAQEGKR